jgi:hypothetical protein
MWAAKKFLGCNLLDSRSLSKTEFIFSFLLLVKNNQKALQCDFCDHWTHLRCTTITVKEYHILAKCDDQWAAKKFLGCNLLDSRSLSKTEFIFSFLFTPDV